LWAGRGEHENGPTGVQRREAAAGDRHGAGESDRSTGTHRARRQLHHWRQYFRDARELYRQLGRASSLAMVAGALCMADFIACAAEVGSQFSEAGGAYLYVRRTFGRFAGLVVAWFWFLAGAGEMAASSNLFTAYLGTFVPALTVGWVRALTLGLLIGIPTIVNCRGVRAHFGASQALPRAADVMLPGWSAWGTVLLLLLSAYGGWEDALGPAGEVKQPRHTLPFALAAGLLISAVLYTFVQYVVTAASVSTEHALAEVAVTLVGPPGGTLVAAAAMLSTYGYMSADVVTTPRLLYSLAVEGDLPELLARVHPRFHAPMYPIVGFVAVGYLLALSGTFLWALALTAGASGVVYMGICASLIRLRQLNPTADALRIPCGRAVAVVGIAVSAVLLAQLDAGRLGLMLITAAIAGANWLWAVSAERQRRVIASRGAT
jgi:APA family basic amino acid/polyamine antiporter